MEHTYLSRLVDQQAPEILLALTFQCLYYRCISMSGFKSGCWGAEFKSCAFTASISPTESSLPASSRLGQVELAIDASLKLVLKDIERVKYHPPPPWQIKYEVSTRIYRFSGCMVRYWMPLASSYGDVLALQKLLFSVITGERVSLRRVRLEMLILN